MITSSKMTSLVWRSMNNMEKKKNILDLISPENLFVYEGDLNKAEPVVEMGKDKNPLYIVARGYEFHGHQINIMASVIYDAKTKMIDIRGRARYEASGNKTVMKDQKPMSYSPKNLEEKKKHADRVFKKMESLGFEPIDTKAELTFEIGEEFDSILKKMNDSGHFDIAVSSAPKK